MREPLEIRLYNTYTHVTKHVQYIAIHIYISLLQVDEQKLPVTEYVGMIKVS